MADPVGFLFVLIAALCWGTYVVPLKKAKNIDPIRHQAFMSLGALGLGVIAVYFLGFPFDLNIFGILSGFAWAIGNITSIKAVEISGMSKAPPIWMSGVIILSFIWGVLFFQETINIFYLAIVGLALLVVGSYIAANASVSNGSKSSYRGLVLAIISGILFGSYLVPVNFGGLNFTDIIFPMMIGILITAWGVFFIKRVKLTTEHVGKGLLSGLLWNAANISSIFAITYLGLAIAFPLTQLSILIAIAWGLLYFKEVKDSKNKIKIAMAAAVLIVGAFVLAFSKA